MNKQNASWTRRLLGAALLVLTTGVAAQPGQIPQIPAFLPMMTTVPAGEPLPIDGMWTVSSIGKRIRIERGRAYAVDPWVHLFVLKIQPGMVVIKDIRQSSQGAFAGSDLPLMGAWQASFGAGGALDVQVASMIPARYQLLPMQLDNPTWYQETVAQASMPSSQPARPLPVANPVDPIPAPYPSEPVTPEPVATPLPIHDQPPATPPTTPTQGVSCREVVYREATDDYQCVQ